MGYDLKYGKVTTEHGDIPDDEPVVVFRAKDKLLPQVMMHYRTLCLNAGSPARHLEIITKNVRRVQDWQREHETKTPDSERSKTWLKDDV
jgi:hypothetical protein